MSKISDRLNDYQTQMSIYAEQHKIILASDVLDMIEQLQDDLKDDIEKVVEELEEHRANFQCKFCKHFYDGKDECSLDCTDALIDNLIDIVRRGGAE